MAESVKACLRRSRARASPRRSSWVRTLALGREFQWRRGRAQGFVRGQSGGRSSVSGVGGRQPVASTQLVRLERRAFDVTIDGKPPSEWQELYGLTRALPTPGGKWPALFDIGSRARLVPERWTMLVSTLSREPERYQFRLARFANRSGRGGQLRPGLRVPLGESRA